MSEEKKEIIETNDELSSYSFEENDFNFVHKDKNSKIHDEALKTKPTTFAKDALKRFAKNKSSVVGAIIIGILLLGSFIVPAVSPHNIKRVQTSIAFLDPKLFNAGTGFWDGTKEYKNQPWDGSYENPIGSYTDEKYAIGKPAGDFESRAVLWNTVKITDVQLINLPSKYATGGSVLLTQDGQLETMGKNGFYQNFYPFEISEDYNYSIKVNFTRYDGASDLPFENMKFSETRVVVAYANSKMDLDEEPMLKVIGDWEEREGEYDFDISTAVNKAKFARVRLECKSADETYYRYFGVESALFEVTAKDPEAEVPEEMVELFNDISIHSANFTLCNEYADGQGLDPTKSIHYWQSNCNRSVYHAEIRKVNFRYDPYEAILGTRPNYTIGGSLFKTYRKNGWCEFDTLENLHETFKVTSKKCPVNKVNGPGSYNKEYNAWQYDCEVVFYKFIGYDTMPRFLFGTDSNGFDIFTKALSCLKTSLLVAIISSVVCLAIGLVWGSISGYFGGNVDIVMERVTDIIAGVPWIVMMTLIILLLGNSVVTFAIALIMTGWIGTASLTRTQFYRFKGREYVLASRTLGASDARLIFKHILPNALGTIVTSSVLMIPGCIFSEASISYLGLGLKGVDSFGVLLSSNQQYLNSHPALIVFPAVIISLLMISFNLFGNGLRDALNPSLKGED